MFDREDDLNAEFYSWACFKAQQAVELLDILSKETEVPAGLLDRRYIPPDAYIEGSPHEYYGKKDALEAINSAYRFLDFVRRIQEYFKVLKKSLKSKIILLYGSLAKGTFALGSDVDILVIAEDLPKNPNERLRLLYGLDRTHAPIDMKAYIPEEIKRVLLKGHPLIMDALADADEDYLKELIRVE